MYTYQGEVNPSTFKISLVILLSVCHTIPMILVERIRVLCVSAATKIRYVIAT